MEYFTHGHDSSNEHAIPVSQHKRNITSLFSINRHRQAEDAHTNGKVWRVETRKKFQSALGWLHTMV